MSRSRWHAPPGNGLRLAAIGSEGGSPAARASGDLRTSGGGPADDSAVEPASTGLSSDANCVSVLPVQWIREHLVSLLALCVAALVAVGGLMAFVMTTLVTTADVERMTSPLATKADVSALPTRADFSTVDETVVTLREAMAALSATVEALSETVDAQRDTIDALSAAVNTQSETVGRVNNVVVALSGTVDRVNETAARTDGVVDTMDGRLDSLTNIVSPLVPCILELHRPPEGELPTAVRFETWESRPLPESCQQAQARARGQ